MEVIYRDIARSDQAAITRLARRSFGGFGSLMVSLERGGHVAVSENEIVGATVLTAFTAGKRRVGLVSWIMVDPAMQGRGIASRLTDLAHEWFADQEADETVAMIEGYNQSSSKLFHARGYARLGLVDQVRRFGAGTAVVWLKSFFLVATGHFIWGRSRDRSATAPGHPATRTVAPGGWLGALGLNTVLVGLLLVRWRIPVSIPWLVAIAVAVPALLLLVRSLTFVGVARVRGLRTVFRPWIGGSVLALLIAGIAGGFMTLPGGVYPRERTYRYGDVLPALGPAALAAGLAVAALLVITNVLIASGAAAGPIELLLAVLQAVLQMHLIVDVLFPVFPLWGYVGRQVWNWSRGAWVALSLVTVAAVLSAIWM